MQIDFKFKISESSSILLGCNLVTNLQLLQDLCLFHTDVAMLKDVSLSWAIEACMYVWRHLVTGMVHAILRSTLIFGK